MRRRKPENCIVIHSRVDRDYAAAVDRLGKLIGTKSRTETFEVGMLCLADRLGVSVPRRLPVPPVPPANTLEKYEKYLQKVN